MRNIYFAITALLLLNGCFTCYHPLEERAIPAEAITSEATDAIDGDGFKEGDWPEPEWWEFFEDAQLNALIETSLVNHPNVKIAEAETLLSCYIAKMTRSALFPSIDAHGEMYRYRQSKTGIFGAVPDQSFPLSYTQTTLLLDFEYQFDWWKKNLNSYLAKLDLYEANRIEEAQAKLMLSLGLAQAYFDYQISSVRKEAVENLIANREEYLSLLRSTISHGLKPQYSVFQTEKDIYYAQELRDRLIEQMLLDQNTIRAFVGLDFLECIESTISSVGEIKLIGLPCDLSLNLIAHRPDIIAQIWRIDSYLHEIYVAKAEFFPNVNFSALIGLQTIHLRDLFQIQSGYGYGGPAIDLPIFDAGKRVANLGARQAEYEIAIYGYENLILQATKEVLDALAQVREGLSRYEDMAKVFVAADKNLQFTLLRQKHNVVSRFDVLDSERELYRIDDDQIRIWGAYLQAQLKLFNALGGGFYCGQQSECEE